MSIPQREMPGTRREHESHEQMATGLVDLRHRLLFESASHAQAQFAVLAAEGLVRRRDSWVQQSRRESHGSRSGPC